MPKTASLQHGLSVRASIPFRKRNVNRDYILNIRWEQVFYTTSGADCSGPARPFKYTVGTGILYYLRSRLLWPGHHIFKKRYRTYSAASPMSHSLHDCNSLKKSPQSESPRSNLAASCQVARASPVPKTLVAAREQACQSHLPPV